MATFILPSLLRQVTSTTCIICRRTEYHESFNTVDSRLITNTQMPDQAFVCPDCCIYYGFYLVGSFVQMKMVCFRFWIHIKDNQWKLYHIVGWNELDGSHILQDLDGSYHTHYLGTCPYFLRTLLDIVAEVSFECLLRGSCWNVRSLTSMISVKHWQIRKRKALIGKWVVKSAELA